MILNSKVIVNVFKIRCFLIEKNGMDNKKRFLLINNVISTLDFVKILAYYWRQENLTISNDHIFSKFCRVAFLKISSQSKTIFYVTLNKFSLFADLCS